MRDPTGLTLRQAAAAVARGEVTAEALAHAYLARIARHEARVRAWAWLDETRMLDCARAADARQREGVPPGPLHGMPIGLKDIIHTRSIPTRMGSPICAGFVPETSATCVERLETAGAYVQGKTHTTEFATQHPTVTTNPWNEAFTPGGSSSGSAAAVAARFTPAALGSQTRGSTIRPAVYCGVVGFKPSFGIVSRAGVHALSPTLDHVGVFARTIDDAGLLIACLLGHDDGDPGTVADACMPAELAAIGECAAPPRLAAVRSPAWSLAEPAQRERFAADCAALRAAGATVEEVELAAAFDGAGPATRLIQVAEIAHGFAAMYAEHADRMSPAFRELCERGGEVTAVAYLQALDLRVSLRAELAGLFRTYDAIVTPPAAGEAPRSLATTGDAAFCAIWTLCGLPCVAFPTGLGPQEMPLGLQVVGPYLGDRATLQLAQWCSAHLPFAARLPY